MPYLLPSNTYYKVTILALVMNVYFVLMVLNLFLILALLPQILMTVFLLNLDCLVPSQVFHSLFKTEPLCVSSLCLLLMCYSFSERNVTGTLAATKHSLLVFLLYYCNLHVNFCDIIANAVKWCWSNEVMCEIDILISIRWTSLCCRWQCTSCAGMQQVLHPTGKWRKRESWKIYGSVSATSHNVTVLLLLQNRTWTGSSVLCSSAIF